MAPGGGVVAGEREILGPRGGEERVAGCWGVEGSLRGRGGARSGVSACSTEEADGGGGGGG